MVPARSDPQRSPRAASHRRGIVLSTQSTEPTQTTADAAATTFRSLGILPETAEALEAVGIVHPFPIQEMTLPVALSGTDVIGQAKTGTGKTLGFGIPLLQSSVAPGEPNPDDRPIGKPQALEIGRAHV